MAKNVLRRIGAELFKYYTSIYNKDDVIYLLIDDFIFNTIISNESNPVKYQEKILQQHTDYIKFYKDIALNYKQYTESDSFFRTDIDGQDAIESNKLIALAIAAFQVKICSSPNAMDENSFYRQIFHFLEMGALDYFHPDEQRSLWDTVQALFSERGYKNFIMPKPLIPQGTAGCNVQYPKTHRLFSSGDLRICRRKLFPDLKRSNIDTEESFNAKKGDIQRSLHLQDLQDTALKVLFRYFMSWKTHKPRQTVTSQNKAVPANDTAIYSIYFDEDMPPCIVRDGKEIFDDDEIVELEQNEHLVFYFDGEDYTTTIVDAQNYAVLAPAYELKPLALQCFPMFNNDYNLFIFDAGQFIQFQEQYLAGTATAKQKLYLEGGIAIARNSYVQRHLPIVKCLDDSIKYITLTDKAGFSKNLELKDCTYDLNVLNDDYKKAQRTQFFIQSENTSLSFSIVYEQPPSKSIARGWDYTSLLPAKEKTALELFALSLGERR